MTIAIAYGDYIQPYNTDTRENKRIKSKLTYHCSFILQVDPSLHVVCSICTVIPQCAPSATSSITVHHQPFNEITLLSIFIFLMNFSCFISMKYFSKTIFLIFWTINITNILKSNSNLYIIYMYMSIAIACGVDVCTVYHQHFSLNYIILSKFIIRIHFSSFIPTKYFSKANFFHLLVSSNRHLSH